MLLKKIYNNITSRNDWLTKEFYETFWDDLKQPFLSAIYQKKIRRRLITSQRKAVIKLIESKNRDKDI